MMECRAVQDIILSVSQNNWTTVEEFKSMLEIAEEKDPKALAKNIPLLVNVLTGMIRDARSMVSGPAIKLLHTLFSHCPKYLENEIERVIECILSKLGGPQFIESECLNLLQTVSACVKPIKACTCFINTVGTLKIPRSKHIAATYVVDFLKQFNLESDIGDKSTTQRRLTGKLFDVAVGFLKDYNPGTRRCGKDIFKILLQHSKYNELCQVYVSTRQALYVEKVTNEICGTHFVKSSSRFKSWYYSK